MPTPASRRQRLEFFEVSACLILSEPVDTGTACWNEVPSASLLTVRNGQIGVSACDPIL